MKKSVALSLTLSILALLPTASYALPQNLVVDFRSPRIGAQVIPLPPGAGGYVGGQGLGGDGSPGYDPTQINLSNGITLSDYDAVEPPFVWSKKYGIAEETGITDYENMVISGLPKGITGMLIDNIVNPNNAIAEPLFWVGLSYDDLEVSSASGDTTRTKDGVTITEELGKDHRDFISFNKPVDQVWVGGYDGTFAIEGFTGSDPAKHVPDGGSTLILFGLALVGLVAFKKTASRI
jgi:hypothetical protein